MEGDFWNTCFIVFALHFNPRPRVEGDVLRLVIIQLLLFISILALVWRATVEVRAEQ